MKKRFIVFYTFKDANMATRYGSFIAATLWKTFPSEETLKERVKTEYPHAKEVQIINLMKVTRLEARHWSS